MPITESNVMPNPFHLIRVVMRVLPVVMMGGIFAHATLQAQPEEENRQYKLAQSYEANGDIAGAARIYKELYDADTESRVYFDGLRRTWLALRKYDVLLPYVEQRVQRLPKEVELRITYAELLYTTGAVDSALAQWQKALALQPGEEGTYMLVAESYSKHRLFVQAAEVFEAVRDRFGRSLMLTDRLARLYAILGEYRKAASEYGDLLAENPSQLSFVKAGMSLFISNPTGMEDAVTVIKDLSSMRKQNLEYLDLLSWLYSENNQHEKAFEVAVQLDNIRDAKGSDIYAFADRALRTGAFDAAIQAYEYFLKTYDRTNPLTAPVIYNYVYALESRYSAHGTLTPEQAHELIDRYREVLEYEKGGTMGSQAAMQIARLQAEVLGQPEEALSTLSGEIRETHSTIASESLLYRAELTLRLGKIEEARALYKRVWQMNAQNRESKRNREIARLRFAETLLYTMQFKEAVDSLTVLTEDVGSDAANDALSWLFLMQENVDVNDDALKSFLRGKFSQVQHDWAGVIASMNEVVQLAPRSSLADNALFVVAEAQRESADFVAARSTLLGIVESYADGTHADHALYLAGEISEQELGEIDRAVELYTKVLMDYPYSQYAARARERVRALRQES